MGGDKTEYASSLHYGPSLSLAQMALQAYHE